MSCQNLISSRRHGRRTESSVSHAFGPANVSHARSGPAPSVTPRRGLHLGKILSSRVLACTLVLMVTQASATSGLRLKNEDGKEEGGKWVNGIFDEVTAIENLKATDVGLSLTCVKNFISKCGNLAELFDKDSFPEDGMPSAADIETAFGNYPEGTKYEAARKKLDDVTALVELVFRMAVAVAGGGSDTNVVMHNANAMKAIVKRINPKITFSSFVIAPKYANKVSRKRSAREAGAAMSAGNVPTSAKKHRTLSTSANQKTGGRLSHLLALQSLATQQLAKFQKSSLKTMDDVAFRTQIQNAMANLKISLYVAA